MQQIYLLFIRMQKKETVPSSPNTLLRPKRCLLLALMKKQLHVALFGAPAAVSTLRIISLSVVDKRKDGSSFSPKRAAIGLSPVSICRVLAAVCKRLKEDKRRQRDARKEKGDRGDT